MTRSVPTTDRPTTAADITAGTHLVEMGNPARGLIVVRVEHVHPFPDTDGDRVAALLTPAAGGRPWMVTYLASERVTMATDEQVADAQQDRRREVLAAELRRLADDIVRLRLPLPTYSIDFRGCLESRSELERWAEYLGVSAGVRDSADRIPSIAAERGRGPGWYGALLDIHMQSDSEPEPVEMLTPEQWQERTGVRVLDADGWSDGKSWDEPIWYPEWVRRMSASTVEQRTAGGVLEARLPEPFAAVLGDEPADDEDQGAEPAGCRGCGKVGKVAPHRPGCSVVAAWNAHRAGDHSMCLAGGVVCAVLAAATGSDGDQ